MENKYDETSAKLSAYLASLGSSARIGEDVHFQNGAMRSIIVGLVNKYEPDYFDRTLRAAS